MAPPDRRTSAPPSTASPTMAALNDCCVLYLDLAPPELHLHLSGTCIAAQSCSMPEAMPSSLYSPVRISQAVAGGYDLAIQLAIAYFDSR